MSLPIPERRTIPRATIHLPSVTIPRRATALVLGAIVLAVGSIGAAVNLNALVTGVGAPTISLGMVRDVLALLAYPAWVAGQMYRGISHGRGIIRSHLAAIAGMGVALVLVVLAVVRIAGGAA